MNAWGLICLPKPRWLRTFPFWPRDLRLSVGERGSPCPLLCLSPLVRRIKAWNRGRGRVTSVHLAESWEEIHFLQQGNGSFQELLTRRGRWLKALPLPAVHRRSIWTGWGSGMSSNLAVHGCGWTPRTGSSWPGGVFGWPSVLVPIFIPAPVFRCPGSAQGWPQAGPGERFPGQQSGL